MSPACELGLALMTACVIAPSDNQPVSLNRSCVFRYSAAEREAAKTCAAENGVTWRINWRR